MKKRIARIVVYFGLTCLTALVLSHPYIWQSIFGPKIKGEPLWAWQQEFRACKVPNRVDKSLWGKMKSILSFDSSPFHWAGGAFPNDDPELLPVLVILADDADEHIRWSVAFTLRGLPDEEQTIATLVHMLDDRAWEIRFAALETLLHLGTKSQSALPRLRAMLGDVEPRCQMLAALTMGTAGEPSAQARAVIRAGVCTDAKSPDDSLRLLAYKHLSKAFKDDDEIFAALVTNWRVEQFFYTRESCILALHLFGEKAVEPLLGVLRDAKANGNRKAAVAALGLIGLAAKTGVPTLESLVDDPDLSLRIAAENALKSIGPGRAKKR